MPTYNGFLIRDSLSDSGIVPSPGYPYFSPDVIAHEQVANPRDFFTSSYSSDPSQPVQRGSRMNPVYVRAKNLGASPLSGYCVSVFRANTSLFMTPSVWRNNPLKTAPGETYVKLPSTVQPNEVGVGQEPFLLDAITSSLYCVVGIVSPTSQPTIPSDFSTYSAYILWVTANQNVCGRNLNILRSYANRTFERADSFSNPSSTDTVPTLFQVSIAGGTLPAGTTFGLQCAPLGVSTTWNISAGQIQTASGRTPPQFNGTVSTWVTLPSGATWPSGVSVETSVWVGTSRDDPVARLATPFEQLGVKPDEVEGLPGDGVLVRLGNVQTVFVTS